MLHPTDSRVVVSIDLDYKNNHTFSSGLVIRHERQWNNLNKRETQPVNAICVSGGGIPEGSEILIHHNASHPVCQILNHKPISGEEAADTVKYFSIPETQCYLWRLKGSKMWSPMNGFATALRIFEPVETKFYGIAPTLIKNTLYITSGELRGNVVHTLKASDYEVIFRNEKGVEERVIRCRHFKEPNEREEIISINNNLTNKVKNGEIYIGISVTDAKPLNQYYDSPRTSEIIA